MVVFCVVSSIGEEMDVYSCYTALNYYVCESLYWYFCLVEYNLSSSVSANGLILDNDGLIWSEADFEVGGTCGNGGRSVIVEIVLD